MSDLELMFNPETGKWSEAPKYKLEIYFESEEELNRCHDKLVEGKYDWHDLKENPNDLPKEMVQVEAYGMNYHYVLAKYGVFFTIEGDEEWCWCREDAWSGNEKLNDVMAWRYIEPFGG